MVHIAEIICNVLLSASLSFNIFQFAAFLHSQALLLTFLRHIF